MSTVNFELAPNTWVAITSTDKNGSVYHNMGDTIVTYVEAETTPPDLTSGSPKLATTSQSEHFSYYDVTTDGVIWAWSATDAIISVTPGSA